MTGKTLMRNVTIFLLLTLFALKAHADSRGNKDGRNSMGASHQSELVQNNRKHPKINNQRAASLVKQRYPGSRILGMSLLDKGGAPVYRARTLSPDGLVKSVFVDGRSGEVFE